MRSLLLAALCAAGLTTTLAGQVLEFPRAAATDDAALANAMPILARKATELYQEADRGRYLDNLFRLQLTAGRFAEAAETLRMLRDLRRAADPVLADGILPHFEIYARAKAKRTADRVAFEDAYSQVFRDAVGVLDDKAAYYVAYYIADEAALRRAQGDLQQAREGRKGGDRIALSEALELVRRFQLYEMDRDVAPLTAALVAEDDARRYLIDDRVLIRTPDGATLSATLFRRKASSGRGPTCLLFTIYPERLHDTAREGAAHGYATIVADARGKRLSPDLIVPYETEVSDVNAVIDWISRQPWSDGQVCMWGNSYSGFAQWAATKRLHPALKTIVPSAAAIPGLGLPMENNVFLNANYGWAFYVTNNRMLDDAVYYDPERWSTLNRRWYQSGRPYREIDRIDGTLNPLLQRWLTHPVFDAYWQAMIPWRGDFAKLRIPVLTITGYYDDAEVSALEYLKQHYRYNPSAEHYLLVGPYQHFSSQSPRKPSSVYGYEIDPAAQVDTKAVIFGWMDHVTRGAPRPTILSERINYEVMGANRWKHAASLEEMAGEQAVFYLTDAAEGRYHALSRKKPDKAGFLEQTVDLADRKTSTNNYYYPAPVIADTLDPGGGFAYVTEPLAGPVEVSGVLTGDLRVTINKKDFDVSVVLYEVLPDGRLFHLSYFVGRASLAKDMTRRQLLTPGRVESVPFERSRLVSRLLSPGSRLMVVVNVNKNPFAQVNEGTGKDVSDESAADAGEPLHVRWWSDSVVRIPISRQRPGQTSETPQKRLVRAGERPNT
jgi:putative CocE/NonD family hydrolase